MGEIDELRVLVGEQEALIKDKADAGHVQAKYWAMLITERRRVEQLRRDVESWQEMYRQAKNRADVADIEGLAMRAAVGFAGGRADAAEAALSQARAEDAVADAQPA